MGQRHHFMIVSPCHCLCRHQGIDDCLLRRLHGGVKQATDPAIGQHVHSCRGASRVCGSGVRCGESDKKIPGAIVCGSPGAREAQSSAPSQSLKLMGQQWGVRGHDNDDRTASLRIGIIHALRERSVLRKQLAHGDTRDLELQREIIEAFERYKNARGQDRLEGRKLYKELLEAFSKRVMSGKR